MGGTYDDSYMYCCWKRQRNKTMETVSLEMTMKTSRKHLRPFLALDVKPGEQYNLRYEIMDNC
jgi:hypothetical protein